MPELQHIQPVRRYMETQGGLQSLEQQKLRTRGMRMDNQDYAQSLKRKQDQAMAMEVAKGAAWADTPEKWNQMIDHFVGQGVQDFEKIRDHYGQRELLMAMGSPELHGRVKSTKIFDDGTISYAMSDGTMRVRSPEGKELSGPEAAAQIKTAQNFSTQLQEDRAKGRGKGGVEGQREGDKAGLEGDISAERKKEKDRITRLSTFVDDGLIAAEAIPMLKRTMDILGTVRTGGINAALLRAKQAFGVEGADEAELAANMGRAVLAQLRPIFGAQFTEREGARLERLEAGFGKSVEGNKRILNQMLKIFEREARRGINAANKVEDDFSAQEIQSLLDFKIDDSPAVETPKAEELMSRLPEGTTDNGDGTFTLPDGRRVAPR